MEHIEHDIRGNGMRNEPNYVLKTNEAILVSKDSKALSAFKIAVCVIIAVIVLGSLMFQENLFSEMTWSTRILLIVIVVGVLFIGGKKEYRHFPLEIHFYNDIIEIHRIEVHYSNGKIKRELHRFFLANNPQVTYDYRNKYVTIKGLAHGEWYLYSKDGRICSQPERVSDTQGICYFYVADDHLDIVKEIEEHSPIRVHTVNA